VSTPIKIVISDDEPSILNILSDHLTKEGYQVIATKDGLEGLEVCRREHPQLAIFDIVMPHMTGIEACEKLREDPAFECMAIFMLTGMGKESDIVAALKAGADYYMTKPFKKEELLKSVKKLLADGASGKLPSIALRKRANLQEENKKREGKP